MDSKILKAIGPYGKRFIESAPSTAGSSSSIFSTGVARTPQIPAFKKVIKLEAKPTGVSPRRTPRAPKPVINFEAFYKKANVKLLQGADSKRGVRQAEMEAHRKAKRTEVMLAKRVGLKEVINSAVPPIKSIHSTNSDGSPMSPLSVSTRRNARIPKEDLKILAPKITDKRQEQLQKWKNEKKIVDDNLKGVKKPPFKPSGPPPVLDIKKIGNQLSNENIGVSRLQVSRPPTASKVISAKSPKPTIETASDRRFTRAMAKAEVIPKPVSTNAGTKTAAVKPAIKGMRNLNLNGNGPSKASGNTFSSSGKAEKTKSGRSMVQTGPLLKEEILSSNSVNEPENQQTENLKITANVVVPKKLKPKGIDRVFIEQNSTFAKACESLGEHQKYWTDVLEMSNIPEDIRDDIISALGAVQLLLGSKLPQFAQLLYSYLCKEMDPALILECDLQGWWDVASIQVDQVQKQFANLKELKDTNWIRKEPEIILAKRTPRKSSSKSGDDGKTPQKHKVVAASKGLRAFLASKRKMQNPDEDIEQNVTSKEVKEQKITTEQPANEKTFEGGFFVISSPIRSHSHRLTPLRTIVPLAHPMDEL